jgi:Carbamoyltransferase C-terminus
MLFSYNVSSAARQALPAVTHVDGSARIQTIGPDDKPFARPVNGVQEDYRRGCLDQHFIESARTADVELSMGHDQHGQEDPLQIFRIARF